MTRPYIVKCLCVVGQQNLYSVIQQYIVFLDTIYIHVIICNYHVYNLT